MRALVCLATVALMSPGLARAQAEPVVALVGGTVYPGDAPPLENATIVIRGERIVSVGNAAPPAGARVIDCAGMVVTPGFIGAGTEIGLTEISLEPSTTEAAPEGDDAPPVRASFRAADGYNPTSTLLPVARRGGVTSVLATPHGGLIAGTSAWADLAGSRLDQALVTPDAALHIDVDDSGVSAAGGARSSALGRLRAALEDARLYRTRRAAYDRRQLRDLSVSRSDLEVLTRALSGEVPVVVRVARAHDIQRVLELGRSFGLRLILAGVEEGWRVAGEIAAADVPVILKPLTNLPTQFSRLDARYDNATLLAAAGVRITISTFDAHGLANLRQEAGNAVAMGLSRDLALRALTSEPARIFGAEDDYGTLRSGRIANVVVWTGDPFEVTTWAQNVIVRGREISTRSRQTMLFERYRRLENIPRGQRGLPRARPNEQP